MLSLDCYHCLSKNRWDFYNFIDYLKTLTRKYANNMRKTWYFLHANFIFSIMQFILFLFFYFLISPENRNFKLWTILYDVGHALQILWTNIFIKEVKSAVRTHYPKCTVMYIENQIVKYLPRVSWVFSNISWAKKNSTKKNIFKIKFVGAERY